MSCTCNAKLKIADSNGSCLKNWKVTNSYISQTGFHLFMREKRHFKQPYYTGMQMDDTGDLENKSSVNFKEPFTNRIDKPNSLGKREAENRQQIVSSHYAAQLYVE